MTAIANKYAALGGASGFLGTATSVESTCFDGIGRYRHYKNGSIFWHPNTGAWCVQGAIRQHYSVLAWEKSFLGYPVSDETKSTDNVGFYSYFEKGAIYWHPDTGAHEIHGDIRKRFNQLGAERGVLGYPNTDEKTTPDNIGRYNHFQNGSIYWHPDTKAWDIRGEIRKKYATLGWEKSFLKYPTTGENPTADGIGRYNHFQEGSIFWHPRFGANEVHGSIKNLWAINGYEKHLGYPLSDETAINNTDKGRFNKFENGYILWTPEGDAWLDYCGNGEGQYYGYITAHKDKEHKGKGAVFLLNNQRPYVFNQDLRDAGLHDNITSFSINKLSNVHTIYMYEHHNFTGRFFSITGKSNKGNLDISNLGNPMNDKVSSIMIVNHGYGSILYRPIDLQNLIRNTVQKPKVEGVRWNDSKLFEVKMSPGTNCLKICLSGTVTKTFPDSTIRIEISFRPYIAGGNGIRVAYAGYYSYSGGSFFGIANSTILKAIENFINNNKNSFVNDFNKVLAEKTKDFDKVPNDLKPYINLRRINILPEGLEIVLCDNEAKAPLLNFAVAGNLSLQRPSGYIGKGEI